MQPWFTREFWPLVIFLFKTIRHFSVIRSMCYGYWRLNKKSVFEKFDVVSNTICIEYLKTIAHFITAFIHNYLPTRHYVYYCLKPLPKKPLISNIKTELSYVIGFEILISSIVWPLITWTNAGSVLMPKVWGIAPTKIITPIIRNIIYVYFS